MAMRVTLSLIYLGLFSLLPAFAVCKPYHPKVRNHPRSVNFTIYQHGTLGKTDFEILNGTGPITNLFRPPFGSMALIDAPLRTSPSPTSTVVGKLESFSVISSMDGLTNMSVVKITLDLKELKLKGSLSTTGFGDNIKPSDAAISGGTGDFLFVQGYLTSTAFSSQGFSYVYKFDFHLFWPPYCAPHA